jgi:hypothetical protein
MQQTKIQNEQMFMLQDEVYNDSITPGTRAELWRKINLAGEVHVKGGIFGQSLDVQAGCAAIARAVFVNDYIKVSISHNARVWFQSVVSTGIAVISTNDSPGVRFGADVEARRVNASNCIFYGNIFCDESTLHNCVVLGGVFARGALDVNHCLLGSFDVGRLLQSGDCALLNSFGVSTEPMAFAGKLYGVLPLTGSGDGLVTTVELTRDDVVQLPVGDDEELRHVVSLSHRFFDLSATRKPTQEFYARIEESVMDRSADLPHEDPKQDEFDMWFFDFLSRGFASSEPIAQSKFMEFDDATLGSFRPT